MGKDACSEEQLAELAKAEAMSKEDRDAKLAEIKAEIKATNKAHDDLLESLQAQFKESQESTESKVAELKKSMKWLKGPNEALPLLRKEWYREFFSPFRGVLIQRAFDGR